MIANLSAPSALKSTDDDAAEAEGEDDSVDDGSED